MERATETRGVDWSQRYGAKCPECGVYTKDSYKHGVWQSGSKVRYHVCPNNKCKARFKSVADDPGSRIDTPDTESLRFLRDYNGRRGGVKMPDGWGMLPGLGLC
ncbi:MAG: hypothetical protein LBV80_07920 [Deltaproteobacteria bacterium]|jgi:hypothetical protein|nr:hypothetical protein [Deltaproteobacteria bacterium]